VGGKPVRLISPTIKAVTEQSLCFTFWFAVFGAGESAQLRVVRHDNSSSDNGEPSTQEKANLELSLQFNNNSNNNNNNSVSPFVFLPPCQRQQY